MLSIRDGVEVKERDTIVAELMLKDTKTNLPIVDPVDVEFFLHAPPGFPSLMRTLSAAQVTVTTPGTYEVILNLGPEGEYHLVGSGVSAAGHRKTEEITFYAGAVTGFEA